MQDAEVLVPAQFNLDRGHRNIAFENLRRLFVAMLTDAVSCYTTSEPGSEARRLRKEAERWFFDDNPNEKWGFSFVVIAEILEINVTSFREGLRSRLRGAEQFSARRAPVFRASPMRRKRV